MITKPKVGLFFGGPSREREISYKGGKTAFKFLDKSLFEPVLIFVDSIGNFIEIDIENMEYDSIRDFYPSKNHNQGFKIYIESLGKQNSNQLYKLVYKIGKQIKIEDLKDRIDIAFPVMHGPYAEDGAIQGLLEWLGIPYVGPNVLASAIGINKPFQNDLLAKATGQKKKTKIITKKEWENGDRSTLFSQITKYLGFPFVIKSPHQGSSIGIGIVRKRSMEEFSKKMHQCFFETIIYQKDWSKLTSRQKGNILDKLTNLNEGIGFPVVMNDTVYHHPADIQKPIDLALKNADEVMLCSVHAEEYVLIEEFIEGQEFSMGLIQDDDFNVFALPATEIYGDIESFDFKSKYQSNVTKKRIPIDTHLENLRQIENYGIKAFKELGMNVICRIDGFLTKEDQVIWHDPNTLPGMSPSSLIFKQLAEIGFTISQAITYLIRQSINQRTLEGKNTFALKQLLQKLDSAIAEGKKLPKKKVAVIFGEEEDEYLAAQTKYNELSSSEVFVPTPICAAKNGNYYIIPVNLMFKANILDFGQSIGSGIHPFVQTLIDKTEHIRKHYCDQVNFTVKKILESELQQNFDSIIRMGANG